MKNNKMSTIIFIIAIIIGLLITITINKASSGKFVILTAEQYKDALDQKNNLYKEISEISNQLNKNRAKIETYIDLSLDNKNIYDEMDKENKTNQMLIGTKDAKGSGLTIVIKDGDAFDGKVNTNLSTQIVHNSDLYRVINLLRTSGAQAISINEQRILPNSSIDCYGPFISVNQVGLSGPFTIKVIGDADAMYDYLINKDYTIGYLKVRGIGVEINKDENIKISGYEGKINPDKLIEVQK